MQFTYINYKMTLLGKNSYPHFINQEDETQKCRVTSLRYISLKVIEVGFEIKCDRFLRWNILQHSTGMSEIFACQYAQTKESHQYDLIK